MSAASGILWELLPKSQILVTYYDGEGEPNRWEAYLTVLKRVVTDERARFLVYTHESPPRAAVESLLSITRGGHWRTALVSPALAVRFVASTFSLAVRDLRYFPVDALPAALEHLKCSAAEKQDVQDALERLRAGVFVDRRVG